ncbi:uncharacterized protein LOC130735997 [Lotus japonicus]|uniref:uncharacterized protein LOC130735997 n=1 Tax=Lotus japonicus TaxID=34305 RepID=UPI002586AD19|nr:uncharacterized protein LOC130735997 [Lotus japonicus]
MILGLPFYAQNCFIISFCLSCRAIKHKPFRLISIVSFIIGWGFLGWFFTHTTNIPMRKGHKPFTLADLEVVVYIAIAHWVYDTMKGKTYGFIITIASLILGSVFLRIALTNTLMKNGTAGQLLLHFSHSHH